ncbi:MAG: 1-acyl-sn-glycerol-3-phosphate acyltransferase [Acidobacteria bacterium]|nr:1-acyl-sn-glycerol-3-phosphate acyltransferase [Acidobacteriota bacterium]
MRGKIAAVMNGIVGEIWKPLVWWVLRTLFSVEYRGLEHVPESGAVIIAGNHPSYLDPVLVAVPVRRQIRFMAWDALFRVPVLGTLIRAFGAFPVDLRKGKGEAAYQEALRVLGAGDALGIFPEGGRSESGPMGELKTGTARLAIETGAPIVPVTIGGATRVWPKWKLLPRPAKILVRFHPPIRLDPEARLLHVDDREYHREVMARIAASINRSLEPALRGAAAWERWYRQPPSHIRTYEWAPLIAAAIASLIALRRGSFAENWWRLWLPVLGYFLYLIADLSLIGPNRLAKWVRNSMPIWLILGWHVLLARALELPSGDFERWAALAALGVFFLFFYEDYYRLQKFVRGLVVVYYFSLLLMLGWPHALGVFVGVLAFIIIFVIWFRILFRWAIAVVLGALLAYGLWSAPALFLAIYAGLALGAIFYLQTFIAFAYDIRREGAIAERGETTE